MFDDAEEAEVVAEEPTAIELRGKYLKKETEEVAVPNAVKELLNIAKDIDKLAKDLEATYGHVFGYNMQVSSQQLRTVAGQLLNLR